jgi:hypothetical protein
LNACAKHRQTGGVDREERHAAKPSGSQAGFDPAQVPATRLRSRLDRGLALRWKGCGADGKLLLFALEASVIAGMNSQTSSISLTLSSLLISVSQSYRCEIAPGVASAARGTRIQVGREFRRASRWSDTLGPDLRLANGALLAEFGAASQLARLFVVFSLAQLFLQAAPLKELLKAP